MSELIAIHRATRHHAPMESLPQANLIENYGLEGDRGARVGRKRQVLIMPNEILTDLALQPGQVRENLTTQGIDMMGLASGTQLQVGDVLMEIVGPCTGCQRMNEVRPGLEDELAGKRGMLARVLQGGQVQAGDPVEVIS